MDPVTHPLRARQYIDDLAASGRYQFRLADGQSALAVSHAAAKVALNRLAKQGFIASPARGFYVIVPPEYRGLGCLPADQFIPALMKTLAMPYYAGLLTAAQYHGAAHQRPQEFQVFLERRRLPIECGKVRVAFLIRKRLREVPVQALNTPRGSLLISTPEATAVDLVGYQHQAGGIDLVATLLAELAQRFDPHKLAAAAVTAPVPWAQRLGYLLERVGAADRVAPLKKYVRERAHESALLVPNAAAPTKRGRARTPRLERNGDWKLYINTAVETDL